MKSESWYKKIGHAFEKASPTLLTVTGIVGIVATVVLAVKATPKAIKAIEEDKMKLHNDDSEAFTPLEAVKSSWRVYIPTAITGAATITCILGANVLNKKQQASITATYGLLRNVFKDYQKEVINSYGRDAHKKIIESLATEKVDRDHTIWTPSLAKGYDSLFFEDAEEDEHLFYDVYSDTYFISTISKILQAEYHLNRNFLLSGGVCVNDFYYFLGITGLKGGDEIGWFISDSTPWIDFNHRKVTLDDDVPCWRIEMIYEPLTYEDSCEFYGF